MQNDPKAIVKVITPVAFIFHLTVKVVLQSMAELMKRSLYSSGDIFLQKARRAGLEV